MLLRRERLVQCIGDLHNTGFHALSSVAARVEVVVLVGGVFHALHVVLQHAKPEFPDVRFGGTEIHGVGGVCH